MASRSLFDCSCILTFRRTPRLFFFFNDPATTEIYTLSLHDALPIYAAVQHEVERSGFSVCHELTGHGIGRTIHEPPTVANVAGGAERLTDGLVLTIEPIIAAGEGEVHVAPDRWTVRTDDDSVSAHVEHTIVVRDGAPPLILTA